MTTRRDLIQQAVAATCIGVIPVEAAAAMAPDPIFAAIERMKAAELECSAATDEQSTLEEMLPLYKRRGDTRDRGVRVRGDDPRWTANIQRWWAATDATHERSMDLLNIKPTTFAGLVALLRYAYAYVGDEGREWPSYVQEDDPPRYNRGGKGLDFSVVLHRHVADAIEAIISRQD
jgi:hypothetical protein